MEDNINLHEWYDPATAAAIISRNSKKHIDTDYVRKLAQYGKIRKVKINDRANLYWKEDVDKYRVKERGVRSGEAAKKRASKDKEKPAA
jgi:hypothetical protein